MATPNYHGRKLLRALKQLREQAGMTQEDASGQLHMTEHKLNRIENRQVPSYHETLAMLKLYRLPPDQWQPYLTLWEQAKTRGWWRQFDLPDSPYVCMEQEAATLTEFQPGYLPQLLQTKRYATKCLAHSQNSDTQLSVRMRRQQRLFGKENPLVLHSLVHEPVLRQGVDGEQLLHLVERAQMPNVTLQIVPQSTGMPSSVILLGFDDPQEPDIAFTESLLGFAHTQDDDKTTAIHVLLRDLATHAMSPQDSLDMLKSRIS